MKKIQVTTVINPDGTVEVEVNGTVGKACEKYTDAIQEAVGVTISEKLKPEYKESVKVGARREHVR